MPALHVPALQVPALHVPELHLPELHVPALHVPVLKLLVGSPVFQRVETLVVIPIPATNCRGLEMKGATQQAVRWMMSLSTHL